MNLDAAGDSVVDRSEFVAFWTEKLKGVDDEDFPLAAAMLLKAGDDSRQMCE